MLPHFFVSFVSGEFVVLHKWQLTKLSEAIKITTVKFNLMLRTGAAILAIIGLFSCENTWMKNLLSKDKGDGTAGNPFRVYDKETLQHVGKADGPDYSEWTLGAHYIQTQNIDMNGETLDAIGVSNSSPFTGSYNGNGKTISNLGIYEPSIPYQGLFGYIDSFATVKNVRMENCNITGNNSTGSIVGCNYGLVQNCHAACNVSGNTNTGGIIGYNYGTVKNCYATGSVTGTDTVGGVVGTTSFFSKIENCHSVNSVEGTNYIGGVVGNAAGGSVKNCYATGSVRGIGTVIGTGEHIGGVVGNNSGGSTIQNCYATGHVEGRANVGGIIGHNIGGTIQNCYATGSVTGTHENIGGLIGNLDSGIVEYCYNTGNVSGSTNVGGVVGINNFGSTVENCYATGFVDGSTNVGGIVGSNTGGTIQNCYYATMFIALTGSNHIGGIVGHLGNNGIVQNCYATNSILGLGNTNVGGIVGGIDSGGIVKNCVALNLQIQGLLDLGRVAGSTGTLINNCARDDMYGAYPPGSWPAIGSNDQDGADLTVTGIGTANSYVFSDPNGWSSSVWSIPGGNLSTANRTLPKLKNMPGAAQNPELP